MDRRGKRDRGTRRQGDRGRYGFALFLLILCSLFLALSSFASQSQASDVLPEKKANISAKAKLSFGYDNNVSERRENRTESRFYQFYVNSGMYMIPARRTLLSMKLQNGLKHLDASSLSGESVLINGLNLNLSHRLSGRFMPEIQSEVRGRTSIHDDSGVPPSEEAFLRGFSGLALRTVLISDVTARAFFRYKFTNFEDFDPFDRRGPQMGLRADVRLLPDSTVSLQYSHAEMRYRKWSLLSIDEKTSRLDTVDDITFSAQMYMYFLFDITYSYQNNDSDAEGYSYRANRLNILLARNLPQDIMFQLYALLRSIDYRSASTGAAATQVELDDDDRAVLTIKLSRDISEGCSLEIQADLRRSRSYSEDGLYTKGVFSSSLSFHF
ncbi:hypothetical protein ACFL6S_26965 [Candidatus Poribacteria bacterium]